jgi:hypothetical protein
MSEFKKRPVKITAVQWTGSSASLEEIQKLSSKSDRIIRYHELSNSLFIETLEGSMQAGVSDWIIKGIHDEIYPCKDDIFKETYTPSGRDKCKKYCKFGNMNYPRPCDSYEVCCFEWKEDNKLSQEDNTNV